MRLGRIASPDGVAFVVIEGDPNSDAVCKEIAEQYLSRNPTFTGRSWPLADVRLLAPILAHIGTNSLTFAAAWLAAR